MPNYKISDDEFTKAVKNSTSIQQVLLSLNMCCTGGAYTVFHNRVKNLQLSTSHFTGQSWSKNKKFPAKIPLEEYVENKKPISSHNLKLRLIKDNIFKYECSSCLLTAWKNGPIPLELDHINGEHYDNTLSNLRLLCPNCHALEPTNSGKNKNRKVVALVGHEPTTNTF